MEKDNNAPSILDFTIRRNITNLFKDFLVILEELEDSHSEALNKLYEVLPEESKKNLYLADHFTDEKMERLRKQVLSKGNDCLRSIQEQTNKLDIKFKG